MYNYFKPILIAFLLLAQMGGVYAATTINPAGSDYWTLYVFGNAEVTYDILTAIKGLLGGDIFAKVLSVFGLIGILIISTAAGFDPGRNAPRFFTLIVTVWLVVYMSMGAVATVRIIDRVGLNINRTAESERGLRGNEGQGGLFSNIDEGSAGFLRTYIVTDVPAIVAIPISMISTLGHWMTEGIETHFPTPPELKVSSGYYNLSAQLIQDANKLRLTDKRLEKTVSNYVNDCVVPALALRRLSVQEIVESKNIWSTLSSASNKALLTANLIPADGASNPSQGTTLADNLKEHKDVYGLVSGGALITCEASYERITAKLKAIGYADAEGESGRTGTEFLGMSAASPISSFYTSSMNWLSSGGMTGAQFVQQKAMISALTGSFREAAIKTGNNELITATSVALAEQSQKSAWVAAADIFNNTMGYVYSALQAFMMAITPLVVLALMLPTFGVAIVKNFLQIFLWLAMWEPMLAVINFLIQSFSRASMGPVLDKEGLTMVNSATVSEMANMSSVAAGFLGTMVPLLTWGLVKGGIAFTEFISHGIGSSFANAAGAQAAGGNVSMGNISMNMANANKMNMATQDAFGYMSTMGNNSAGSITSNTDGGGLTNTVNGGAIAKGANLSSAMALNNQIGNNQSAGAAYQGGLGGSVTNDAAYSRGAQIAHQTSDQNGLSTQEAMQVTKAMAMAASSAEQMGMTNAEAARYIEQAGWSAVAGVQPNIGKMLGDGGKGNGSGAMGGGDGGGGVALPSGGGNMPASNSNAAGLRVAGQDSGGGTLSAVANDAKQVVGNVLGAIGFKVGGETTVSDTSQNSSDVTFSGGNSTSSSANGSDQTAFSFNQAAMSSLMAGISKSANEGFDTRQSASLNTNASFTNSASDGTSMGTSVADTFSSAQSASFQYGMTWHDAQDLRWGGVNAASSHIEAERSSLITEHQGRYEEGKAVFEKNYGDAEKRNSELTGQSNSKFDQFKGETLSKKDDYAGNMGALGAARDAFNISTAADIYKPAFESNYQFKKEIDEVTRNVDSAIWRDPQRNVINNYKSMSDADLKAAFIEADIGKERWENLKEHGAPIFTQLFEKEMAARGLSMDRILDPNPTFASTGPGQVGNMQGPTIAP